MIVSSLIFLNPLFQLHVRHSQNLLIIWDYHVHHNGLDQRILVHPWVRIYIVKTAITIKIEMTNADGYWPVIIRPFPPFNTKDPSFEQVTTISILESKKKRKAFSLAAMSVIHIYLKWKRITNIHSSYTEGPLRMGNRKPNSDPFFSHITNYFKKKEDEGPFPFW